MAEKLTAEKSIEERVAAPIQQVWDLLSDFSAITRRTAGIQDFKIEGEGAGADALRHPAGPLPRMKPDAVDGPAEAGLEEAPEARRQGLAAAEGHLQHARARLVGFARILGRAGVQRRMARAGHAL